MMSLDAVANLVREKGVEFFLCSFVEMGGMPKAKLVPAKHLHDMAAGSAGFAGFAAGNMGQGPHDPDFDESSYNAGLPERGLLSGIGLVLARIIQNHRHMVVFEEFEKKAQGISVCLNRKTAPG